MDSKQRVLTTIKHKRPDRIPLDGWWVTRAWNKLEDYYGTEDSETILENLGIDFRPVVIEPAPDFKKDAVYMDFIVSGPTFSSSDYYAVKVREGLYEDEWGARVRLNKDGINWGYTDYPLRDLTLKNFKTPDLNATGRLDTARQRMESYKDKFIFGGVSTTFRKGWILTGFTAFLEALILNRDFIDRLLDRIVEYEIDEAKTYASLGVDMIELLGDLGTEESLFLSPKLWREIFKPRMKMIIDAAKSVKKDLYFFIHSCGMIEEIIPDLIEIGIDILNPVQPECIDPVKMKKIYGDKLTLHGTMSLQRTFSFGSTEDVIEEAKQRIERCGYDGGLTLGPSNFFTHNIPVENVIAFYEFVKNYQL